MLQRETGQVMLFILQGFHADLHGSDGVTAGSLYHEAVISLHEFVAKDVFLDSGVITGFFRVL